MEKLPPAINRAFEGLTEGRGRTVVIAGPPFSGKSELLSTLRSETTSRGFARVDLRGSYRHRTKPYEALASFEVTRVANGAPPNRSRAAANVSMYTPAPAFPMTVAEPGESAIPRSLEFPAAVGPGVGRIFSGAELHRAILRSLSEAPSTPIVLLVEDAALFDPESRDALLFLLERARYRPVLVVIALDVSLPAYQGWEEQLLGRVDVDWVRLRHPKPDPREAVRLREQFELLPIITRNVLLQLVLLGGNATEVALGRVTRMGIPDLAEALAPGAAVNLVRTTEGRLVIPHDAWIDIIPGLVPEPVLRRAHLEVAEALAAMTPEPDLKRRMELTHHYYEAAHDALALRYLIETAEICDQLYAFDAAEDLLGRALACVDSLPKAEQAEARSELKLLHARSLIFSGRVAEAERELRDGFGEALGANVEGERLEEWADLMLPSLRVLGPRPSLTALLSELADRCREVNARGAEVLFMALLAEGEYERGRYTEAQRDASRAVDAARGLDPLLAQSASLLSATIFVALGGYAVEAEEELFLSARTEPGRARRSPLFRLVEELELRLVERARDPTEALQTHQRAIPVCQRLRVIVSELYHLLDLAEIELDQKPGPKTPDSVQRASEIVEVLHLFPPAPAWARAWLLKGRIAALEGRMEEARDIWTAIADRPPEVAVPRYSGEAIVRLALADFAEGREEAARAQLARLGALGLDARVPQDWAVSEGEVAAAAGESRNGSGRIPSRPAEASAAPSESGPGPAPSPPSTSR